MSSQLCCKIKAVLTILMLAVAEARHIEHEVHMSTGRQKSRDRAKGTAVHDKRSGNMMFAQTLQGQTQRAAVQMEAIIAQPSFRATERLTREMEAMMAPTNLQEHAKHVAGQIKVALAHPAFQAHAKLLAQQLEATSSDTILQIIVRLFVEGVEAMMGHSRLQERAERVAEQIKAKMYDRRFQTQAKLLAKEIDAMMSGPNFRERVARTAKRMEALIDDPIVIQRARRFVKQVQVVHPTIDMQEQLKYMAKEMAAMISDSKFKQLANRIVDRIDGVMLNISSLGHVGRVVRQTEKVMTDPDILERVERVAEQLRTKMANLNFQEQRSYVDTLADNLVVNLFKQVPAQRADMNRITLLNPARFQNPFVLKARTGFPHKSNQRFANSALRGAGSPSSFRREAMASHQRSRRASQSKVGAEAKEFPVPQGAPEATGTVLGAISLVAGTTVGAGILALPAKTFDAGFAPSAATLLLCWLYMSASGLLIAEVNVNTLCALEKGAVNIDTMAEETLGKVGARVSGVAYVFIHYALLVAYMLQGGNLLLEYLNPLFGASAELPTACGPLLFLLIAGGTIFISSEQQVELGNSILFGGVVATFVALVALGAPQVDASLLTRSDLNAVLPAVPVMILSLVYHNVVPTICYQLGCDLNKIRTAIVAGTGIPTFMFILWNLVILGSVPPEAASAARGAGAVFDPLEGLRASGDAFGSDVRAFSLLAIITSFIGFVVGLVDYFADALAGPLSIDSNSQAAATTSSTGAGDAGALTPSGQRYTLEQRSILFACTLLPPLAVAEYDPSLFFAALDTAGTYGILVLFGILPAAMAWQQRSNTDEDLLETVVPPVLPGGDLTLGLMAGAAAAIVALESYERLAGTGIP